MPAADAEAMANAIGRLLSDESLRRRIGENAVKDARKRFDLRRHANDYLVWYEQLRRGTLTPLTSGSSPNFNEVITA